MDKRFKSKYKFLKILMSALFVILLNLSLKALGFYILFLLLNDLNIINIMPKAYYFYIFASVYYFLKFDIFQIDDK